MQEELDRKRVVESVRKAIEASSGTHIWRDYLNALGLISQVVFTRSSGFILELMQNAEDAGLDLQDMGVFEIGINKQRVKVTHNGRPFNENDVKALCGIRSSKKPERGTLGYLGIGFKSVFKVTDCPEVYSNGYQFKFDRNHEEWGDPSNTPWHVLPIWIDQPSEPIDHGKTTFVVPFREEAYYADLREELANLRTELYLFLRWLKRIEVADEVSGTSWVLENTGTNEDGITTLKHDGHCQRFRFFRRLVQVPDWVKEDRLTQDYRADVVRREIVVAFALDDEGNLAPREAGAMYGGVYSFLPLAEARSGAKFPIQADFLVQPGREAINYEAKWNHWLVEEVADLCEEAIDCFKKHDEWKHQFLPMFEFSRSIGLESHDNLFGPRLIEPLEDFLKGDHCVPTMDGGWGKPGQAVRLLEDQKATEDLVGMGVLKEHEIAPVLGGQPGLKLVDPRVGEWPTVPFKKVDRRDLLNNKAFLEEKCRQRDAVGWFRSLYGWLQKNPVWIIRHHYQPYRVSQARYRADWAWRDGRTYRKWWEAYHNYEFVLTANLKLLGGGDVSLLDLPSSDPLIKSLADELKGSKTILHPGLLAGDKQEVLRRFLMGLAGVQLWDVAKVCRDVLLPKILTSAPKPSQEDLLRWTIYCQRFLYGWHIPKNSELWVLTKQGDVRPAKEVFFATQFKPEQDWETRQQYVGGLSFISQRYIQDITDHRQVAGWRQFLKAGGVKDAPDGGVEEFAMNYAQENLKAFCESVKRVDKRNFGYDIEAATQNGEKMHVEVKGLSQEGDVVLTGNETEAADTHKETYYLCVVSSIPDNPQIHMLQNPAEVGKKDKLTIPVSIWKPARWP